MPNILDVGSGQGQRPKEAVEVVITTEAMATESFKLRPCAPRHAAHINWPLKSGKNQCREVSKFNTTAITLCAAIQIIWSLALRLKTPNAWQGLVERLKVWTIKTPSSVTHKYARFGLFVALGNLMPLLEGSLGSAKVMLATFITAGGA
jgi:hypothetical protein